MLPRVLILLAALMAGAAAPAPRADDVVNVRDYGAVGDGVADDTAAINAAIAYARTNLYDHDRQGFHLVIPQGRYLVTSPINLTMFDNRGVNVDARGATLIGRTAGKAVVDMIGTRWAVLDGLTIYGDSTRTPSIGIQLARATVTTNACSNGVWNDVTAYGRFTFAAVYIMSCETSKYYNLYAFNNEPSADSYGLVLDGVNHFNVPSDFVTGSVPVDTPRSFNEPNFFGLMVDHGGGGVPLWMANTARMTVQGGYLATTVGKIGMVLYSHDSRDGIRDLSLDLLMETNAIAYEFFLTGPNTTPTLDGFRYREQGSNATVNLFKTDAGIAGVTMRGADIDLNMHMPRVAMFSDPDLWTVSGRYRLPPGSVAWNLADRHFSGMGIVGASTRFVGDGSALSGIVASQSSTLNAAAVQNTGGVAAITLNDQASKHGGQYPLYLTGNAFPAIAIQPPPAGGAQAAAVVSAMGQYGIYDRYAPGNNGWLPQAAGSGYHVNDILTAVGGAYTEPFTLRVLAVDTGGAITRLGSEAAGSYSAAPAEPIALSGGHGSGASIAHLTWNVLATRITAAGAGYSAPPAVTFAQGVNASPSSTAVGAASLSSALTLAGGSGRVALGPSGVAVAGGLSADTLRVVPARPNNSHAACAPGQISADENYVYVCTGPNSWKRAALGGW